MSAHLKTHLVKVKREVSGAAFVVDKAERFDSYGLQEYAGLKSSKLNQKDEERCEHEKNFDKHLKLLFDFLDFWPEAKKIDTERARHNWSRSAATFEMLWMLFPPGTDVFIDAEKEVSSLLVIPCNYYK